MGNPLYQNLQIASNRLMAAPPPPAELTPQEALAQQIEAQAAMQSGMGGLLTPQQQALAQTHLPPPGFVSIPQGAPSKAWQPMAGVSLRPIASRSAAAGPPPGSLAALAASSSSADDVEPPGPKLLTEGMSPEQLRAAAGKMVVIGGGGGGAISKAQSVKRTPQAPGYVQGVTDATQAAKTARLARGEAEAKQAEDEALVYGQHVAAMKARTDAAAAAETVQQARIAEEEARLAQARSEVAAAEPNPDRWWSSRTMGQKVALGISAMLTGFVQGFRGQGGQNPTVAFALEMIDRDMAAQRVSLEKKEGAVATSRGVLGELYSRLGDMRAAEQQYRVMQLDVIGQRLKQISATSQSAVVRANAAQDAAEMDRVRAEAANVAYGKERGEITEHTSKSGGGGPVQKVSLLELLNQQQLKSVQLDTATKKARLEGAKAQQEYEGLNVPDSKPKMESGDIEALRKINTARDNLDLLYARVAPYFSGKRKITPDFFTSQQTLRFLLTAAKEKAAEAIGTQQADRLFKDAIFSGWDSGEDARQKLLTIHQVLGAEAGNRLRSLAPVRNVKPYVLQELQRRQLVKNRYGEDIGGY